MSGTRILWITTSPVGHYCIALTDGTGEMAQSRLRETQCFAAAGALSPTHEFLTF